MRKASPGADSCARARSAARARVFVRSGGEPPSTGAAGGRAGVRRRDGRGAHQICSPPCENGGARGGCYIDRACARAALPCKVRGSPGACVRRPCPPPPWGFAGCVDSTRPRWASSSTVGFDARTMACPLPWHDHVRGRRRSVFAGSCGRSGGRILWAMLPAPVKENS
jgi:hypothetical protein